MNPSNVLLAVTKIIRPRNNRVFFISFNGLYNDNPRAISEKMHELYPELKLYWYIDKNRCKDIIPDYIHAFGKKDLKFALAYNSCRIVVENGAGFFYCFADSVSKYSILKNPKQIDIATWHGTPLKKIGFDTPWDKNKMFFSTADFLIAGSEYELKVFESAFGKIIPLKLLGNSRNDILVKTHEDEKPRIKKKLQIPNDKKIVLFAPTFRESQMIPDKNEKPDFLMNMDINRVLDALSMRFGHDWSFVFRGHQMIQNQIDKERLSAPDLLSIVDGNLHDDMAEYLAIADVLITDYSGSLFDFALTGKPCFLYAPDFEDYVFNSHGIYGNIKDLPYSVSCSMSELVDSINTFDNEEYKKKVLQFIDKYKLIHDGKSAERVVEFIVSILKK